MMSQKHFNMAVAVDKRSFVVSISVAYFRIKNVSRALKPWT